MMNENTRVVSAKDIELWRDLFADSESRDIFLDPDYITLFDRPADGEPSLFVYGHQDGSVCYPFFDREFIQHLQGERKVYHDAISPWPYGGIHYTGELGPDIAEKACDGFKEYALKRGLISHFSRMNPYHDHHTSGSCDGSFMFIGQVYPVDLSEGMESILRTSMRPSCQRAVRKSYKIGLKVTDTIDDDHLMDFQSLYKTSMDRKNARETYRFSLEFLRRMAARFETRFVLLNSYLDDSITSGAIFLISDKIMYYYISARDAEIDDNYSMNRLILEAMKRGVDNDLSILDLGGGKGNPGLENFKTSFTSLVKPFFGKKQVFDRVLYRNLCSDTGLRSDPMYENAFFFPEYRCQQ